MKVTQEKLPASQIGLEIEIPSEMSKDVYEKTLREFTRSLKVPGFRKGKVPRQVLIQRFGSQRIKAAVLEELIEDAIKQAIEQEKLDVIGNFQLRTPFDDLLNQFEPNAALTFTAAVDVPPEATLKQYKGLQVQAEEVKYKPEQVDEILETYRRRTATMVPVENRAAQLGDVAIVDFIGYFAEGESSESIDEDQNEPKEIPGGKAEDFQLELEQGQFIEGFIDGIVGMNPGETREILVKFPDDYPQQELAGKSAQFTVSLKDLKEKELPELDDDFAQDVSEFETIAELRESLESRYQKEADEQTQANKEEALLSELLNQLEVELPETLVKREVDFLVTQTVMQLDSQGLDIKKMLTPEIVEGLRERSRPEAITRLKRTMALGEVAKQESIQVEESAINAKVEEIMQSLSERDVDPDRLRQVVEEDLLKEQILTWLEENGTVELVPEGSLQPSEADKEAAETEPTDTSDALTVDVESSPLPENTEEVADTLSEDVVSDKVVSDKLETSVEISPDKTESISEESAGKSKSSKSSKTSSKLSSGKKTTKKKSQASQAKDSESSDAEAASENEEE
jgi:trigger factor